VKRSTTKITGGNGAQRNFRPVERLVGRHTVKIYKKSFGYARCAGLFSTPQ